MEDHGHDGRGHEHARRGEDDLGGDREAESGSQHGETEPEQHERDGVLDREPSGDQGDQRRGPGQERETADALRDRGSVHDRQ